MRRVVSANKEFETAKVSEGVDGIKKVNTDARMTRLLFPGPRTIPRRVPTPLFHLLTRTQATMLSFALSWTLTH